MRRIRFSDLPAQYNAVKTETLASWGQIMESGSFIGGDFVRRFEAEFASYVGADYCVGVGNGTDALEIGLLALDLPRNSAVLVPANSFVATAEAAVNVGLRVEFVDVLEDYSIDILDLKSKIDANVSCLAVVHLYGHPAPMMELVQIASSAGLKIIEDCAQAHGAEIDGQRVGTFGSFGAFSFYPGKNLGAAGDAGAIVSNDEALTNRVRRFANHGRLSKFDHDLVGRNSRLDALQAAILSQKLKLLDAWNLQRNENAETYRKYLEQSEFLSCPPETPGSVYHHFVIRTPKRDQLKAYLADLGIETGIHYPDAIPDLAAFKDKREAKVMRASAMAGELLSLPVAEHLGEADIEYVSATVNMFFQQETVR